MTGSFPNRVSAEVKLPAMHVNPFGHQEILIMSLGSIFRNIELIYEENASESDVLQGIYKGNFWTSQAIRTSKEYGT